MTKKRNVIFVTDGDPVARRTLEVAARNIGARCISMSAGNPSRMNGQQLVELIKTAGGGHWRHRQNERGG
ncbi:stage V sporulation protein AE [Desulforamulus putei]|uniref:stage V sporulation protein AE n=1 Tax=Desulforamulus putei TaxID=74701 RepID=UPI000B1960A6